MFTGYSFDGLPIPSTNLGFLGLSVLELGRGTRQTDRHNASLYSVPSYGGRGITRGGEASYLLYRSVLSIERHLLVYRL